MEINRSIRDSRMDGVAIAAGRPGPEEMARAFAALGSPQRLAVLAVLVRAGPDGLPMGTIQDRVGIAASTLSHHVRALVQAGIVRQDRDGRSLVCRAEIGRIEALAEALVAECCRDAPPGHRHDGHEPAHRHETHE